ncbi:hypothetical protein RhiirB3_395051, partial [Rhizophagus irregularis]
MPHFFVNINEDQKNIIEQKIVKVDSDTTTFNEIYEAIAKDMFYRRNIQVYIGKIDNKWVFVEEGLRDELSLMLELELKHIKFIVQPKEHIGETGFTDQSIQWNELNIFNRMMERVHQPYFPMLKRVDTRYDFLYNDVIALLKKEQRNGWRGTESESFAKKFVERLVALFWYIDPHRENFISRSLKLPEIFDELEQYQCNGCYNNFYHTGHHKKEQLSHEKLEQLVKSLELSVEQPWASKDKWMDFINQVILLIEKIKKYANYLREVNKNMNVLHNSDFSACNPGCDLKVYTIEASDNIHYKYQELSDFLFEKDNYKFFDLEEFTPHDIIQKYNYIKNLQLNVPVTIYQYHQGNYLGTINYIWKIPLRNNHRSETENAHIIARINEELPKYYTRQMHKNALKRNTPAVDDDRRQQEVLYMPIAISIRDLCEIIINRLEIRLQFWPTNLTAIRAMHYTGRFNIKYQIQARQLRKNYPNAHYCACLFRYLREFSILYRDYVCFIAADDKHKIQIGEGVATSTGVRNKKSLVGVNSTLAASDHDFTKLSFTPLVIFFIDVLTTIEDSFYHGNVFVSYKDIVFQPSNAIRHSTEFFNTIQLHYTFIPPILCLYTDSGPDHRTTFGSVQISLICLFLRGNFDLLIALRTALYHSWANPAERIMSIINLELQGVAIMRESMSVDLKGIFKKADTLDEIRAAANKNTNLKNRLYDCILNIQQMLHSRTERLVLHENPFQHYEPANDQDIDNFFKIILEIDKSLNISETTANILSKKKDLQEFLKTHCKICHYSFQ